MADSDVDILSAILQATDPEARWVSVASIASDDSADLPARLKALEKNQRVMLGVDEGREVVSLLPLAYADLDLPMSDA
jgi:hypothetical protein